jgi:hypothetical protein
MRRKGRRLRPDWGSAGSAALPPGTGVFGAGNFGYGVVGWSTAGQAILGMAPKSTAVIGTSSWGRGVHGVSDINAGVEGWSELGDGVVGLSGVIGPFVPDPVTTAGVWGISNQRHGVIGTSNANAGVFGYSSGNVGVIGATSNPASYAGVFKGNVFVLGDLRASGQKAAVVPFPDGSQRLLYCMESPELWFEDFGSAKLARGRAVVKLDTNFAKVIKRGDIRHARGRLPRALCAPQER